MLLSLLIDGYALPFELRYAIGRYLAIGGSPLFMRRLL